MKILIYTSTEPGVANKLNIHQLMESQPQHEYTFVAVRTSGNPILKHLSSALKIPLNRLRGRDVSWYVARRQIEARILRRIPKGFWRSHQRTLVQSINGADAEAALIESNPDLIIQAGAGILKKNIFSVARMGTLNVHHGIAPEIRGISAVFWAMYYGLHHLIGTTVHFIDESLDTGTVVLQKKTELPTRYDYLEAMYQTAIQGALLLPQAIEMISNPYRVQTSEVTSYYFGSVGLEEYARLVVSQFQSVGKLAEYPKVATKIKTAVVAEKKVA